MGRRSTVGSTGAAAMAARASGHQEEDLTVRHWTTSEPRQPGRAIGRAAIVALLLGAGRADAQPTVEAGLVVGLPAALPTGLTMGAGVAVIGGGELALGAAGSWSGVTEYALTETVAQDELRLRALGVWQHEAGRGMIALRLGLGATAVRETRTRDQGSRAGLTGDALETTTWALLPAADLELAVTLRVIGAWGVAVSGGPSVDLHGGALHAGWTGVLGVAWQP
jgi:hypothetical protein